MKKILYIVFGFVLLVFFVSLTPKVLSRPGPEVKRKSGPSYKRKAPKPIDTKLDGGRRRVRIKVRGQYQDPGSPGGDSGDECPIDDGGTPGGSS
ncbi:hypothetical protein HN446_04895 [bacterium]|jgi:hypothetical protein|nr:hypothetical protein [bacterium]